MKKIILILSLCLSLLGLSSITYAAEWNWIASNDSTTISFDKDSIRKSQVYRGSKLIDYYIFSYYQKYNNYKTYIPSYFFKFINIIIHSIIHYQT